MGRNVTAWRDTVAIYNKEVRNEFEANELAKESGNRMKEIEKKILAIAMNPECLRDKDDERAIYYIVENELFNEDFGLLDEYAQLAIQKRFAEALAKKYAEIGEKPKVEAANENGDEGEEIIDPVTFWGHYGDFELYSSAED